jgi:hypothetical protein
MRLRDGVAPAAIVLAVLGTLGFASIPMAAAQQQVPPDGLGEVTGEVARCAGSLELPAPDATVGVQNGQTDMAHADGTGSFSIALTPGEYNIVATAADGSTTALRDNVPVVADQVLDIGILDLGAGIVGCGDDTAGQGLLTATPTAAPLLPTITPTAVGG